MGEARRRRLLHLAPKGGGMDGPKLVIEMAANGQVSVTGPIGNKTLCYGLLECAKDAIRDHVAAEQSKSILTPSNGLVVPN